MRRSVSDAGVGTPAGGVKMAAVVERFAERVVSASGNGLIARVNVHKLADNMPLNRGRGGPRAPGAPPHR